MRRTWKSDLPVDHVRRLGASVTALDRQASPYDFLWNKGFLWNNRDHWKREIPGDRSPPQRK